MDIFASFATIWWNWSIMHIVNGIIPLLMLLMIALSFGRQIQSAINEGQLSLSEMYVDTMPFFDQYSRIENVVLVRPHQVESTVGKNRKLKILGKTTRLRRPRAMKFMLERSVDSWKNIKITIKSLTQGGGGGGREAIKKCRGQAK